MNDQPGEATSNIVSFVRFLSMFPYRVSYTVKCQTHSSPEEARGTLTTKRVTTSKKQNKYIT